MVSVLGLDPSVLYMRIYSILVLPGSAMYVRQYPCISFLIVHRGMVYDDAEKLYAEVRKDGEELLEDAFATLFPKSIPLSNASAVQGPGSIIAYNTTFLKRRDVVKVPLVGNAVSLRNKVVQASKDGSTGYALLDCSEGGHVAKSSGLFADCMPVSGKRYELAL